MSPLNVVAIVSPAPGKESVVESILVQLAKDVHTHEHDVMRYQPYKQTEGDSTDFVVVERYKDAKTLEEHFQTAYFQEVGKKIEAQGLLAKPLRIMKLEALGSGFDAR